MAKTNRKATTKATTKGSKGKTRAASADRVKAVVEHKAPPVGKTFPHKMRDGRTFVIERTTDGYTVTPAPKGVKKGHTFGSPSSAGTAVAGHQVNGWIFWPGIDYLTRKNGGK